MLLKKKTIVTLCLGAALLSPVFSYASGLVIINNTSRDSTSILNNGPCSTILGDQGVTRAHNENHVSDSLLKKACVASRPTRHGQAWICKADVYMTNNCSGSTIGTVVLDVSKGIQKVEIAKDNPHNYVITYDPETKFTATISGGPAFNQWLKHWMGGLIKG